MRTRPPPLRSRRAQAAVETLLMMPLLVLVLVAMYYLWSIAWASENAHLRAREYVLHGDEYLGSHGNDESGNSVFSGGDYQRAGSTSFHFSARSSDESLPGVAAQGERIDVQAVITSD